MSEDKVTKEELGKEITLAEADFARTARPDT